jgi:hypothetical protein
MDSKTEPLLTKHLARNVPVDFNLCVERQRAALQGDLNRRDLDRREKKVRRFRSMIECLSDETLDYDDLERIDLIITEVQLRYLVLSKTLDQSIPPTPIKRALGTLNNRLTTAAEILSDPDRDEVVKDMLGLSEGAAMPATREAFERAQSFAERAAIASQMVANFSKDVAGMEAYFDYKARLTPRGNQAKFAMAYAVSSLADLFESENQLGRKAAVNIGIRLNEEDDQGDFWRYTGVFLRFMTEFFRVVDDAEMVNIGSNSFADRLRLLAAQRRKDPSLFRLLHGDVTVETMLEFMKRVEEAR